jgi:hypothetical protein
MGVSREFFSNRLLCLKVFIRIITFFSRLPGSHIFNRQRNTTHLNNIMDFDNLPHLVLMKILMYVPIQDRVENVRLVSKWWKSVAEDTLWRERKLAWLGRKSMKTKANDHHSIKKICPSGFGPIRYCFLGDLKSWRVGMVRYWSHIFSLCPNIEEFHMDDDLHIVTEAVTELLNLMNSRGIRLKSFTNREFILDVWPLPLDTLESLAVTGVSDELVVEMLEKATNLKHLELCDIRNWPTFPSGLSLNVI